MDYGRSMMALSKVSSFNSEDLLHIHAASCWRLHMHAKNKGS
jgi:hypothetical protein